MRPARLISIVGTLGLVCFLSNFVVSQDNGGQDNANGRVVRLSMVSGDVFIQNTEGGGYQRAFLNIPVTSSASIWTRDNGAAEIELESGSTIRLTPQTVLGVGELNGDSASSTMTAFNVQQGLVYFAVRGRDGEGFAVNFGGQTIAVNDRAEFRVGVTDDDLELAVLSGDVDFKNDVMRVTLHDGESIAVDPADESRYELSRQVDENSYDAWNQDREQYRDDYAQTSIQNPQDQSSTDNVSEPAQPPDSSDYAATDLNYYGIFFAYAGYGTLWRPRSFPKNWNPYANGAWVYEPGYGYVWVSAYPWGWAPFHFGRWIYIGSVGWCWQPAGHSHNAWNPSVRLVNAPAGVRMPAKPMTPGKMIYINSGPAMPRGTVAVQPGMAKLPAQKAQTTTSIANAAKQNQGDVNSTDMVAGSVPVFFVGVRAGVPITPATIQGPNVGASGHWMGAATSPGNFYAATSPRSFSAASGGVHAASSGMSTAPGMISNAVSGTADNIVVVPVEVVSPAGQNAEQQSQTERTVRPHSQNGATANNSSRIGANHAVESGHAGQVPAPATQVRVPQTVNAPAGAPHFAPGGVAASAGGQNTGNHK